MNNKNKTNVQANDLTGGQRWVDNDELFTVNGRVYRKNSSTQKTSPTSAKTTQQIDDNTVSNTTPRADNDGDANADTKYNWAIYLVVYVVGVVICLAAGAGVYALVWPLMAAIVVFLAALVVWCIKG